MLFFFELLLFVLVMVTLALGEFVGRGWALGLWLLATALGIGGYFLARGTLQPLLTGQISHLPTLPSNPPSTRQPSTAPAAEADTTGQAESMAEAPAEPHAEADSAPTPLDAKWAQTLLYNWRRTNVLLLLGTLATFGWYWLGA